MTVYIGDITKIKADVIVNAADQDFTGGGGIFRWIVKQGGQEIEKEAQKFAPGEIGKVYVTNAGSLPNKKVFHIPTVNWHSGQKLQLVEVHTATILALEKLRELRLRSIVFPLLGAGTVGLKEKEVFVEIVDAISHMENEFKDIESNVVVLNKAIYENIKNATSIKYKLIELE